MRLVINVKLHPLVYCSNLNIQNKNIRRLRLCNFLPCSHLVTLNFYLSNPIKQTYKMKIFNFSNYIQGDEKCHRRKNQIVLLLPVSLLLIHSCIKKNLFMKGDISGYYWYAIRPRVRIIIKFVQSFLSFSFQIEDFYFGNRVFKQIISKISFVL